MTSKLNRSLALGVTAVLVVAGAALGAPAAAESTEASAAETGTAARDIAVNYIRTHAGDFGLHTADVADLIVTDVYTDTHNGVTHVYLLQRFNGLEVYNALSTVNVASDGSVISAASRFVPGLQAAAQRAAQPALDADESAESAASQLGVPAREDVEILASSDGADQKTLLSDGGISQGLIPAKLVYQPLDDGTVRLAWNVEIEELAGEHYWNATVDAATGELLGAVDYVSHDNIAATAAAVARPAALSGMASTDLEDPRAAIRPPQVVNDGSSYRVYRAPLESPSDGPRTVENHPADAFGSPYGWHDTDGAAGPEFTTTQGNNVHAYTDQDANNVPDPGSSPDGGPKLAFHHPQVFGIDFTQHPSTYAPAAVTNLFYWNNVIHDLTYRYGFTEAAGNFQVNNYGRGGLGGDDVRAEAQDGAGVNNANFGTPVDGNRPRMQMFLWNPPVPINTVTIDAPSSAAGTYAMTDAAFGPDFDATGVSGDIVLVDDGVGVGTDGCEPLVGFPSGAVALIDRGTCNFTVKVANAQAVGATAVIIANNAPGNPITLGGSDPTIMIPSGMISLDDANTIKAGLPATGTVSANPDRPAMRDGDLDAGIIIHEYGHGVSNRLTGGPATVSCLGNQEQMGEGWSDWLALSFTALRSDSGPGSRGIGTYALFQPDRTATGIRPTAYSTDMAINPTTYDDIQTLAVPHGVGYAWATMLWEMYWNLVDEYGFNPNPYGHWSTGGNNLATQLVMDGMKFQPCSPGFVDGRDAILDAEQALTGGENQCLIWAAFAKRGLGFSADQGSSASRADGTEAFDTHPDCE